MSIAYPSKPELPVALRREATEGLEPVYSIPELMTWSGESESTWRKRIQRGELHVTHFGSNVRIARTELEAWLRRNTKPGKGARQ